jgi:hypothetical protein
LGLYVRMALSQTGVPAPATYSSDHATWQTVDICVQRKLFPRSQENMATRYTFPFIPSFPFIEQHLSSYSRQWTDHRHSPAAHVPGSLIPNGRGGSATAAWTRAATWRAPRKNVTSQPAHFGCVNSEPANRFTAQATLESHLGLRFRPTRVQFALLASLLILIISFLS